MRLPTVVALALLCGACSLHGGAKLPASIPKVAGKPRDQFALRSIDFAVGKGAPVAARKCLYVHYTGWLTNGTKFDSSRDTTRDGRPGSPISFPQGSRRVIAGWDLGFDGMKVGGRRRLFIPYQLAYGETARGALIPARSDLIFDVELMAVMDTMPRAEPAARGQAAPPPQCRPWPVVEQ